MFCSYLNICSCFLLVFVSVTDNLVSSIPAAAPTSSDPQASVSPLCGQCDLNEVCIHDQCRCRFGYARSKDLKCAKVECRENNYDHDCFFQVDTFSSCRHGDCVCNQNYQLCERNQSCVRKYCSLNSNCDLFEICDLDTQLCKCQFGFIFEEDTQRCSQFKCSWNLDCQRNFGEGAECQLGHCYCDDRVQGNRCPAKKSSKPDDNVLAKVLYLTAGVSVVVLLCFLVGHALRKRRLAREASNNRPRASPELSLAMPTPPPRYEEYSPTAPEAEQTTPPIPPAYFDLFPGDSNK